MENIPCTKHEAFPGMILRISTCNEALDSQNGAQRDSETGVVTDVPPSYDGVRVLLPIPLVLGPEEHKPFLSTTKHRNGRLFSSRGLAL